MFRTAHCLALLLLLAACRPKVSPNLPIDPALRTLTPKDAIFLAGVRVDPLKQTPLWKQLAGDAAFPMFRKFQDQTGIDPRRDIWELLYSFDGKEALLFARGRFAEPGMEPRLNREGVRRFAHKGRTLLGDDRSAVTFINSSTAAAGSTPALKAFLDARDAGATGMPARMEQLASTLGRNLQLWFVGVGAPDVSPNLRNFTKGLETARGGVDFSSGIDGHITIETATPEDAKRLHDTAKALIGLARLNTRTESRQTLRLLDGITIVQNERRVEGKLAAPVELLDELLKLLR